ncbi:MAG: hypothetical protein WD768_03545 [Phycisphaeraceae bacterium]
MKHKPQEDPLVAEVREIAMRISAQFDHDPVKYLEHLRKRATEHPHLMVDLSKRKQPSEGGEKAAS